MSATRTKCPHCAILFRLPDGPARARVRCPRCDTVFAPEVEPVVLLDDEPEEPAPRSQRKHARDEDDRPRTKRESAAAPPRKKRRKKIGEKIATALAGVALLVVVVGLGGYLAFPEVFQEEAKQAQAPKAAPPAPAPPALPKPVPLTQEQIVRKVKDSTAYVRTFFAGGQVASGSGFFTGPSGFVVTNAHVIGFGPKEARIPLRVDVVQNSGELNERTLPTTIFGIDAVLDLAILRVETPDPPAGLPFGRASELVETQEVVIFGYPFGEQLGRNVSVNRTTVSSLRKVNGMVGIVQLAGGMNPGNSGGPVTNTRGEVIGVSVAGIKEADAIAFAIPAELTDQFVHAQVATGGWIRLGILGPPAPTGAAMPWRPKQPDE